MQRKKYFDRSDTMSVRNVNWIDFERKNPNKTEAFEKMCTHIFCREYNISPQDIVQFFN